jgi:hypothetical protein
MKHLKAKINANVVGKGRLMSLAYLHEILYPTILVLSAQYL